MSDRKPDPKSKPGPKETPKPVRDTQDAPAANPDDKRSAPPLRKKP